jgi:hypothetical protein
MHLNLTVTTTSSFDARIHEVAAKIREQDDKAQGSMKVRSDGELKVSLQQGEIFVFKRSLEFTALNREYFTQVVRNLPFTISRQFLIPHSGAPFDRQYQILACSLSYGRLCCA